MSELIQYQRDDGIVTLTLNSPETRNPISDDDMIEALLAALERLVRGELREAGDHPRRRRRLDALLEMSAAMQALARSDRPAGSQRPLKTSLKRYC